MSFKSNQKQSQLDSQIDLTVNKHGRLSEFNRLVYPVVSRRSGGLSLGINLNPDKKCTFDCVYCQVDRFKEIPDLKPGLMQVKQELEHWITLIHKKENQYRGFPLKDIAIAGDGEPTTVSNLPGVMKLMMELRLKYHLDDAKLVLFTNGSNIDRLDLNAVLPDFFDNNGEVWFKLDYWDQASLTRINRTKVSFERMIRNLKGVGSQYPLVLQSCFFSWEGELYKDSIYENYIAMILKVLEKGTQIDRIQAYTLARTPAEEKAKPWPDADMDNLVTFMKNRLPLKIEKYYANG
jgi:wyosine [tRNA(Phe)-imidazoG37] synthetase (radical SAM superfamily)